MSNVNAMSADDALKKLKEGNELYITSDRNTGDISPAIRTDTVNNGQHPYAVIITCSDSRVIPESIFSAGIGDLFVIRVAGNVIDNHQLGSIEYAAGHLGCKLVMVLGHNHCGAVDAAMHHKPEGFVKSITDEICKAIGDEKDDYKACCLNAKRSVEVINKSIDMSAEEYKGMKVVGALYRLEDGRVEFDI